MLIPALPRPLPTLNPPARALQKYYHKGAFYMDEGSVKDAATDVRARAADAPAEHEAVDRSALPKLLQVKKFGMRGQSKYTNLAEQDTSGSALRDDLYRIDPALRSRLEGRQAGLHGGGGLAMGARPR